MAGLKQTGRLNRRTRRKMRAKRCGRPDKENNNNFADFKALSKWNKKVLTYRIYDYPKNSLTRSQTDSETRKAFDMWQEVAGISFQEQRSGTPDIVIKWAQGSHGDGNSFDGRSGVLAHAYFPGQGQISGDAHFDDAEPWSITPHVGVQVLNTLIHEFGHSLGLAHSSPGTIMEPYHRGWDTNLRLSPDDIAGIQSLYGRNTDPIKPTKPNTDTINFPNEPTGRGSICRKSIDTIVHASGNTYVFIGDQYYKLTDTTVAEGYPRSITQYWDGLPGGLDASVRWDEKDYTYFFKGSQYWRFKGTTPESGYPKDLSEWGNLPSNLDAAFQWSGDGNLYFFKGSKFWKFDTNDGPGTVEGPQEISNYWGNMPTNLHGALKWSNGNNYVFKGRRYWRLDTSSRSIDNAKPSYPRSIGLYWYDCPKTNRQLSTSNGGRRRKEIVP